MISVEEIKSWQQDPVTVEFFSYILQLMDDADAKVHFHLSPDTVGANANWDTNLNQAAIHNAVVSACKDIMNVTEEMIDVAKEGDE